MAKRSATSWEEEVLSLKQYITNNIEAMVYQASGKIIFDMEYENEEDEFSENTLYTPLTFKITDEDEIAWMYFTQSIYLEDGLLYLKGFLDPTSTKKHSYDALLEDLSIEELAIILDRLENALKS